MKRVFSSVTALLLITVVAMVMHCTSRDGDILARLNPLDAKGDSDNSSSSGASSSLIAIDTVWEAFDFTDSTGGIACSLLQQAAYAGLDLGRSVDSLDSVYAGNELRFLAYGLDMGTTYYFRAVAYTRTGDSLVDSGSFVSPAGPPPATPGRLRAESDTVGVRLAWAATPGASEYLVYYVDSTGAADSVLTVLGKAGFVDRTPDYDVHTYRVAARNRYGESAQAGPVSARKIISLPSPDNLAASQGIHGDHIALSWDSVSGASGYAVLRAVSDTSAYGQVGTSSAAVFFDSVDAAEPFYYQVASTDDSGRIGMPSDAVVGFLADTIDVPPNLTASKGVYKTHIALSWGGIEGAEGYILYRSGSSSKDFSVHDTITGTTYQDSVKALISFYYRISAFDKYSIETAQSATAAGSLRAILPPSGIKASDAAYVSYVEVSWSSVQGADRYVVYRSRYADSAYQPLDTVTGTSYRDSGATTAVAYYTVSAIDEDGEESAVGEHDAGNCRTVGTPTGVYASDGTYPTHVRVVWKPVEGAAGYNVYRSSSSISDFKVVGHTDTTFYDDSLETFDKRYYKVAAYGADGKEGPRSGVNVGNIRRISAPTGVSASTGLPEHVRIAWRGVSDAQGYYLYRATSSAGTYNVIDTTSDTVLTDSLTDRTYAYYRVASYTSAGTGHLSGYSQGALLSPPTLYLHERVDHLRLTWSLVSTADSYALYRAPSASGTYTRLVETTNRSYNDTVSDANTYYYKVSAINEYGETRLSSYRSGAILPSPSGLTATLSGTSIRLEWHDLAGASSYRLYRSSSPDTGFTYFSTSYDTSYTTSVSTSGTYYYRVRGYVSSELTGYSNTASVVAELTPLAPRYLSSTGYAGYVKLSWSHNTSGDSAAGYIVYRSSSYSGTYTAIDTTELTAYNDSSMTEIRTYYYKVSAYNANGESQLSSSTSDSPLRPSAPSGLTASNGLYGTHVELSWDPSTNVDGYIIFRSTYSSGSYTRIDTTTDTVYHDSAAPVNTTRYYRIASYGPLGESYQSSYEYGRTLGPPSSVSASGRVAHIRVYWSTVTYATEYLVYRGASAIGMFTKIGSTSSTYYYDTVSTPDYYYYRVASKNQSESELSSTSNGARRSVPSAPSMVSASQGTLTDTVSVTWHPVPGAESYKLYRSPTETFTASTELRVSTTDTTVDDPVTSDSLYYYRAKAINAAGESVLSTTVVNGYRTPSSAPAAPSGLAASDSIASYIGLLWNSPSTDIPYAGYVVYRSESSRGPYAVVDSTADTTYSDYAPASFPTYYWYVIKAYNTTGESAASNEASGTRQ